MQNTYTRRIKDKETRSCERSCNLLFSKEFNDRFRRPGDPQPNFYSSKDKHDQRSCCCSIKVNVCSIS